MFAKLTVEMRGETAEQTSARKVFLSWPIMIEDYTSEFPFLFMGLAVRLTPGRWVCEARTSSASGPEVRDRSVGCRIALRVPRHRSDRQWKNIGRALGMGNCHLLSGLASASPGSGASESKSRPGISPPSFRPDG